MPRKQTTRTDAETTQAQAAEAPRDSATPSPKKSTKSRARSATVEAGTSAPPVLPPTAPSRSSRPKQLLALLGGDAPVALAQICQDFGWQPHTARAAISALRKAGHRIDVGRSDGGSTAYSLVVGEDGPERPAAAVSGSPGSSSATGRSRRKATALAPTDAVQPAGEPGTDAAESVAPAPPAAAAATETPA
jgi:hypothetical protein